MENLKELQKHEAIIRMKHLNLLDKVIKDFNENQIVYYSERQNHLLQAVLYSVSGNQELEQKIQKFEESYDSLVYHVQLLHTEFGDMYSFLYVSKYQDEWKLDGNDLQKNQCYSFVWNGDIEEFGLIGFQKVKGGVVRIW
ncbi:MAG: hypothetical protein E7189_10925 [Erysipelotrichaceae bacterium]|nr:hypothetical protein [Erysipelotrichaceae bacterium]